MRELTTMREHCVLNGVLPHVALVVGRLGRLEEREAHHVAVTRGAVPDVVEKGEERNEEQSQCKAVLQFTM